MPKKVRSLLKNSHPNLAKRERPPPPPAMRSLLPKSIGSSRSRSSSSKLHQQHPVKCKKSRQDPLSALFFQVLFCFFVHGHSKLSQSFSGGPLPPKPFEEMDDEEFIEWKISTGSGVARPVLRRRPLLPLLTPLQRRALHPTSACFAPRSTPTWPRVWRTCKKRIRSQFRIFSTARTVKVC